MLRIDHQISKFIYRYFGLDIVRKYQRVPFFDFTDVQMSSVPYDEQLFRADVLPFLFHSAPFDDCSFCFFHDEKGVVVIRFCTDRDKIANSYPCILHQTERAKVVLSAWIKQNQNPESAPLMFTVYWVIQEHNDLGYFNSFFDLRESRLDYGMITNMRGTSEDECRQARLTYFMAIVRALRFLELTDLHRIEVTPEQPTSPKKIRQAQETRKKKPWLREDLSRIILLDQTRAPKSRVDHGGTHASPIPHRRRAHFKKLRSPRFKHMQGKIIRVKSAWIGDREWIHKGAIYKVIEA